MARINTGFPTVKEFLSYAAGMATLYYGVVKAAPDRQLIIVAAAIALLGLPMAGNFFERKG